MGKPERQLRDVLGEFVKNFKWKTTRVEWIKALRQSETKRLVELNGNRTMAT